MHLTKPRLQVADRQYARMKLLLGEASFNEKRRRTSWFSSDLSHQAEIRGDFQDVAPLATYHGEIGREATAVAEMLSDHAQPTTGKSVGKPRHAMSNGDEVETLPRRNRWGSRASQMRMEAGKGRQGCDLAATAPNVYMRNGKPFGPPGGNVIAFVRC